MSASTLESRLHYLDAVRAFALLLGIVFHASLSFLPIFVGWAVMDVSTSPLVGAFMLVSHSFRMELFFLIAGFFGHRTFHAKGAGTFLKSRFVRIVVPFMAGWFLLRPLIVSGWVMGAASLRGEVDIGAALRSGFQSLAALPQGIFTGSHLWFLYYLTMATVATVSIRALVVSARGLRTRLLPKVDAVLARLAGSRLAVLRFALPTAVLLWFMRGWGVDTPDQTLRPHIAALLLYSGFFACGWMLSRNTTLLESLARPTVLLWLVAVISMTGVFLFAGSQRDPGHPHFLAARAGHAVSYAVMMWSLVFLTIGVLRRLVRGPNAVVRYVADSSYWMYLIHLPIVVWMQVASAEWPLHWSVKIVGVSVATILIALVTYDLFVRSTIIGQVLNGRRRDRVLFPVRPHRALAELHPAAPVPRPE